jgi:hypothetical protein
MCLVGRKAIGGDDPLKGDAEKESRAVANALKRLCLGLKREEIRSFLVL